MNGERGVFCNRTLNMRSIRAIGYDMDYTLIQYDSAIWETLAYQYAKDSLLAKQWPVAELTFDPHNVTRGLIIDVQLGNLVKSNRFGFVKKAVHGTKPVSFDEQRKIYARTVVDLHDARWIFLNTLFSLSEGCLFAQLVDLLDQHLLPGVLGYEDLYRQLKSAMDSVHAEGRLKAEILTSPERFVMRDPDVVAALLDQKHAGKKLLLITNSEWAYTSAMMSSTFDPFLPAGGWRALFDVVIVGARKPEFFTTKSPLFEVVTDEGLLKPIVTGLRENAVFLGGSAAHVEQYLGVSGYEILYVGDHMFGDVHVTKDVLRWRTALILRELEDEILAQRNFTESEQRLGFLMSQKHELEAEACAIRLDLQRRRIRYVRSTRGGPALRDLSKRLGEIRVLTDQLDEEIAPLARSAGTVFNPNWGPLMRAGNDKSHLANQMERYADIYTSRVSNLMSVTPFAFLRAPRGSLPHDPTAPGGKMDATQNDNPIT
ncbi:MAG TPA: HAD-IG family 5'-nucleotidase [Thermoanaerobaculia bacterium]|nr:HAD-IG family 5'-nucleotidase [Thermoanaerobaculia bacterium]